MADFKFNRKIRRKILQLAKGNTGSGFGLGNGNITAIKGNSPTANPFMQPKMMGLNVGSKFYFPNYYQTWDISAWRLACDQAINMAFPSSYGTMIEWVESSSPFIKSLKREIKISTSKVPIYLLDENGVKDEIWTKEICEKKWFRKLRQIINLMHFDGFGAVNFDPIGNQIFKYPIQNIDYINQAVKRSTYEPMAVENCKENENLLFIQHSNDYTDLLGWMQPISRAFIEMNQNSSNWLMAGKRFSNPIPVVYYPQSDVSSNWNGSEAVNTYREEAELILRNFDPSNGLTAPYTLDNQGKMVKALDLDFISPKSGGSAYKVYEDFNEIRKNEIREMIMLSTLTSSGGLHGTKGLGEVHERKFEDVIIDIISDELDILNDETDFLKKVRSFYKNMPENLHFGIDKAKQWEITEVIQISNLVNQNGYQLKPEFFTELGLDITMLQKAVTQTDNKQIQVPTENESIYKLAIKDKKKNWFSFI